MKLLKRNVQEVVLLFWCDLLRLLLLHNMSKSIQLSPIIDKADVKCGTIANDFHCLSVKPILLG